ncbi:serine hydrolase domain-containing protein [Erythrobacter rubeus]|uniref:Serine hydrolase n=1 Tax=Erythrobacter rubeus TaxID=2760803 RepID=A0ABR8KLW4_9SPHN|nr:serine hydrolase [Erythrobacter rubeus]MBD2841446.1 serine hydrolase [Erythrobacter rubeus]
MKNTMLAAVAALTLAIPAAAQSSQDQLDARYDRALAAGYKALFLCSAMAAWQEAEQIRTPEQIMQWDLAGIDPDYAPYIAELPVQEYRHERWEKVEHVAVSWADDMPPRVASVGGASNCTLKPIGETFDTDELFVVQPDADRGEFLRRFAKPDLTEEDVVEPDPALGGVFARYMGDVNALDAPRSTAMIVTKGGQTIGTSYADGYNAQSPQRTWSVAKSLAATWIGAVLHNTDHDVNEIAIRGLRPEDPRSQITIDHMLRMASGRYSDTPGNRTDPIYWGGSTVHERARSWPVIHPPGTVFRYANNDTLMAVRALDGIAAASPEDVFRSIGMTNTHVETDTNNHYILSSQVWTTARDLVKLGQLYLDDGVLPDGQRLLKEGWVDYVSSPSGPQPEGRPFGYGASFWLLNNSEGVPADTYAAMGNRGQFVVIVPSRDVVIVRRGEDPSGTRFDIAAFTRDLLAAIE